jgi:hypothetical protein
MRSYREKRSTWEGQLHRVSLTSRTPPRAIHCFDAGELQHHRMLKLNMDFFGMPFKSRADPSMGQIAPVHPATRDGPTPNNNNGPQEG